MRILLVGASGAIGQAVARELGERHEIVGAGRQSGELRLDVTDSASIRAALKQAAPFDALVATVGKVKFAPLGDRHEIVTVGRRSGQHQVDITDSGSIRALFETVGRFDALVAAAGKVHFGDLAAMTETEMAVGLKDKLMGQVNLVLLGQELVADGGSFTLTSGVLSHDPIRFGSSASMVNGAIDAFVRAAAIELPRGLRINAVSPGVLVESLPAYGPFFRGHEAVPAARVALAYAKSVEGARTGQVFAVL